MANESGDMKLLGNFSKLVELVSIDSNYNPANALIKVPALNAKKAAALAAVENIGPVEAAYKAAINDRQEGFEGLSPAVSRAGNMFKASGAGKKIQDDLKTAARKLTGRRKTAKIQDNPNTPQGEASKSHSASQMSFENRAGNFVDFIEILKTVPAYTPNEPDLTTAGLTTLANDLKARNASVSAAFAPVSAARGVRDQLLYLSEDCVVNIALLVKAYVRAAFGPDSQLFQQIKGLEFARQGKKPRG
jgi:hypothetical protein